MRLLRSIDNPLERLLAPLVVREIVLRLLRCEHAVPLRRAARADDLACAARSASSVPNPAEAATVGALAGRVAMSPSHFATASARSCAS